MMKGVRLGADGAAEEEFNTNITDKDERKRLRKKRIEKRHSTETKGSDDNNEAAGETHRTGGQQVSDSLYHLDRRKHTGLQDVTEIRVRTDNAELKRRMNDEEMRRDRLDKLQKEAADELGINLRTYEGYERGIEPIEFVKKSILEKIGYLALPS